MDDYVLIFLYNCFALTKKHREQITTDMMYKIAAITDSGIASDNQDNFFCNGVYRKSLTEHDFEVEMTSCRDNRNIYAVFDGIGGLSDGSKAALSACEALYNSCWKNNADIGTGILEADNYVMNAGLQKGLRMGSTCVIVEEIGGCFRSWNVGDSRAYYYQNNEIVQISKDHTEAENARTVQCITGEAFSIPDRYEHSLTQYLGSDKSIYTVEPFVSEWIKKNKGSKLLLCSDGLYNYVDIMTITEILQADFSTIDKCRKLKNAALSNRGKDNITVVIIEDEY